MRGRIGTLVIVLAGLAGLVVLGRLVLFALEPGLIPKVFGTGDYITEKITDVPHPFSFERPRLWTKRHAVFTPIPLTLYIQGPADNNKLRFVQLRVRVGHSRQYPSFQAFIEKSFPFDEVERRLITADNQIEIWGIPAEDVSFTYTFVAGFPGRPDALFVPSRGRAILLEDRGQYNLLEYTAAEEDYDRYVEVFDRMVRSIKFLE